MDFEDLIKGLGARLGIELSSNSDGTCVLSVDDMTLILQNIPEVFSIGFCGEIGEPPPYGQLALQTAMLEANHFFRGTGGATISRDSENGKYYLCRVFDSRTTDIDAFVDSLEKFVNTLEAWRQLLADYRPEEEPVSGEPAGSSLGGFMQV